MPGDSKHDKNLKITDFTTKLLTSAPKDKDQVSNSHKESIRNLSPLSPGQGTKKYIMEITTDTTTSNAKASQTRRSSDSISEIKSNASLQKALSPLITKFHLLRKPVNTVHADYTDLKQTRSKQKDEVKHELVHKIETNTQQLNTIAQENK